MAGELPRIVVVEDDASMSVAIERILKAGGLAPVMFASAEAALEANATTWAECLVLDIHLPGMSGLNLYQRLIASGEKTKAIFISAYDEPAIRIAAERMGASGFLHKPFSGRSLLEAVGQAIDREPELRREEPR